MKSTPESIMEAQRALAQYMEEERQSRQCAPVDAGAKFDVEDEAQHSPDFRERMARVQAEEYVKARNQNLRPLRQIDQSDENAREGRESALAFLERRRRSAIRK